MANINLRTRNIGATLADQSVGNTFGWQVQEGPGMVLGFSIDFAAAADGSSVITMYDGVGIGGTTGVAGMTSIYAQTGNTDLGTTVPVQVQGDGDLVAGTSTAGVYTGLIFTDGLWILPTADVTGPQLVSVWTKSLVKKSVNVTTTGADGSGTGAAQIWQGPGFWHGYAIKLNPLSPSTTDLVFRDSITDAAPTVMTKTNYTTTPGTKTLRQVVTTTSEDEAGAVVTTAATGAYNNSGILLRTGLRVVVAQSNAFDNAVSIDALFEV